MSLLEVLRLRRPPWSQNAVRLSPFKDRPLKSGPDLQIGVMQAAREGSPPPGLRLPQTKLSRKYNQVARGRIRQFESNMPSQAVASLWGASNAEKYARHCGELP